MRPSSEASKLLLRRFAPHTQAMADVPACPPSRNCRSKAMLRLLCESYLWPEGALALLGPPELVRVRLSGDLFLIARDHTGREWGRLERKSEWQLSLRERRQADPTATRASLGFPDWDPEDVWLPAMARHEWSDTVTLDSHETSGSN